MSTTDQRIIDLATPQHLILARGQLRDAGITERMIDRRIAGRFLVRVHRGVYALLRPPTTPIACLTAAQLALPGSAAFQETAAALHGMPGRWPAALHLVADRGGTHDLDGVTVHETKHLPAVDITVAEGVRATTVARTVCDLAAVSSLTRLQWITEQLIIHGHLDPEVLLATYLSFRRRGRTGSRTLRFLLDHVLTGSGYGTSVLEQDFIALETAHRLPPFARQQKPPWYDGIRGVVDFVRWLERLIVEVDGRAWHSTRQAIDDDRSRDRAAARHGFLVLRYGASEIRHRPDEVAGEIQYHLDQRRPATAGEPAA